MLFPEPLAMWNKDFEALAYPKSGETGVWLYPSPEEPQWHRPIDRVVGKKQSHGSRVVERALAEN